MLLVHPVRALRDLLPLLIPAFFIGANNSGDGWDTRLQLAGGVLVLLMAFGRWATTAYRITGDQVQLREGLLNRRLHTVRLDRVRSVDTTASLLHRMLGLTTLTVGTAATGDREHPMALDGLDVRAAERLRVSLLHRQAMATPGDLDDESGLAGGDVDGGEWAPDSPDAPGRLAPAGPAAARDVETEIVRFDPAWLRFAPLGTVGIVAGLALLGLMAQVGQYLDRDGQLFEAVMDALESLPTAALVAVLVGIALVTVVLLAVSSTASAWWGLRVVRHSAGVIKVTRGLFTTRSTSLDVSRIRGVRLADTPLLRPAGAATLKVLSSSVHAGDNAAVLPAAPLPVVTAVASDILQASEPLATPLIQHGPGAARRRWTRALWLPLVVLAGGLLAWSRDWPTWMLVVSALPLLTVPWLARGRYAALGHAVVATAPDRRFLVSRQGCIDRRTVVLDTAGVVGWQVRESFWQRRAGVATVHAATAAGDNSYPVIDVPTELVWPLADAATPGMLDPFRESVAR